MARTVGDVAKAIALPVKGEVGRRLLSAGGHFITNTAEGGSLAPIALPQVARYLTAQNAAQQAAETVTGIPADEGRVMATREAYRTALNDPMDRALGITPLSNRPDVAPFDMAAQFAVPMLAERAAALGGNLAFRAGANGVTRDMAAGLNRPLTAEPTVTPPAPDLPPEVRFPPEKAAVVSLLDKQRAWNTEGRAAFVKGEGPGFGGEVPRAMTPEGQPTAATVKALSPDNPFAPEAKPLGPSLANERGALGVPLDESGRIGPLYHGSPHKFEQFDLSKVGTGEGAQAYGHGLYFAENKSVAKGYQEALAGQARQLTPEASAALKAMDNLGFDTRGQAAGAILQHDDWAQRWDVDPAHLPALEAWRTQALTNARGALYTADLPDAEVSDFLHWDKPLSEQPEKVRRALEGMGFKDNAEILAEAKVQRDAAQTRWRDAIHTHGDQTPQSRAAYRDFLAADQDYTRIYNAGTNGEGIYRSLSEAGGDAAASARLRAAGIRGVRYLDGSSRRAGEGSYNYAVFDDKDIRILNREGKGALKYLTGLTGAGLGGAGGAAAGSQIGATPEERRRNAIIGGVLGAAGGAVLGVKGGQAVEAMGERGAAPIAPEAPPKKLADVKLKGEPLQGPLRKPEENTVKRLVLPEALSEQVRQIGREFTGPGYESFGQVKRKAQSLLKSGDVPIDFTRGNRAEVLGAAALLRQNTEETGRLAVKLANPKLADVERAALEQQMAQLEQTSRTLFNSITSAKTEQARDLAANRILANLSNTPEHWQYRAQKIAERPLADVENAKIRGLLDAGKRDEALRYIGSLKPTTMQERLISAWKAMLLTNPRTHAANTASNIVFGLTEEAARNPAAFADWVATKLIGGDRTKTPTNLAILKASAEGAAKGLRQMPNRLRGLPTGRALEEGIIPHEAQWGHPILTTLFNAPFRFLEAADAPFFESALRGSLAEQATLLAKAEGAKGSAASRRVAALIDSPTDEMVGRALYDAAVRTYKDPTAVGNVLQSVQKNFPVAGNIVMPFTKTPGAVATRFAEYTPYGFFKGARLYKQAIAEAVDGLPNPRLKQMAAENLGRATVGLGPIALGALLYRQGKASGQVDPGDKSARETQYLLGVPNDAFKIGGQWVEPNRLGPQGMLLSLGAVMAQQAAKNEQTPLGAVGGAAFAGVRTVTDQPFLTGVQSLLQAREGADNAARYFANLSGSLVPSVIGAVEATGDPYMRDAQTAGDKLRSRIPGKAEALPTRTDQLGQPAQRFGPGPQNLLSPIRTSPDRVTGNPILEEIRATGAEIPALGRKKDETPQAYQVRATVIGKRVQQAITELMAAPEYRALPPEQRKDVLEDRVRAVRARAAKYPAGVTP